MERVIPGDECKDSTERMVVNVGDFVGQEQVTSSLLRAESFLAVFEQPVNFTERG